MSSYCNKQRHARRNVFASSTAMSAIAYSRVPQNSETEQLRVQDIWTPKTTSVAFRSDNAAP